MFMYHNKRQTNLVLHNAAGIYTKKKDHNVEKNLHDKGFTVRGIIMKEKTN